MKRAILVMTLVISAPIAIGYLFIHSSASASPPHHHAPAPVIRSSLQLAAAIRHHDYQGGSSDGFTPQVTVTCRRATPRHSGAYDHVCRESYLAALCIVGSTPDIYVLVVDVLPRGYHTVRTRHPVQGACELP